ncbi:MAG: cardiolipin synthase [Thermoplasmata archaeon]|nr:cardiolipin synthase [Thermoplasmata archaeon]
MPDVDEILSFTNIFSDLVMLFVVFDVIALFIMLFLERCDPRVFVTWLILLTFLPPAGFILYMYLGATIYNRRRFKPKNITDTQMMEASEWQRGLLEEDLESHRDREDIYYVAKSIENAGAWSYTNNNDIDLYTEGEPLFADMMEDIRNAERSILIEYYIIRNDHDGNELMKLLIEKVRQGVEVRLLTDAFGIGKGPKEGIYRFRNAGGHYATFHATINLLLSPKKNNRNHRKIALIDGRVAYCGGFNIGDEYRGEGPLGHWRDATVRVEGAGILPMMVRFCADWQYCARRDPLKPMDDYIDPECVTHAGRDRMHLVSGGPDTMPNNPIQMQYHSMIVNARQRLYVTTPYLNPDDSMMVALANAARSGVDVRILIPDKKDHIFLYWNNLTCANELMKSGVRIWRYNDGFVHEKMMLMDDVCCSVGSANFDHRSTTLNFETNVMMYSRRINEQACAQFLADLEKSTEYSCAEYDRRTTMMRIRMAVSWQMKLLA